MLPECMHVRPLGRVPDPHDRVAARGRLPSRQTRRCARGLLEVSRRFTVRARGAYVGMSAPYQKLAVARYGQRKNVVGVAVGAGRGASRRSADDPLPLAFDNVPCGAAMRHVRWPSQKALASQSVAGVRRLQRTRAWCFAGASAHLAMWPSLLVVYTKRSSSDSAAAVTASSWPRKKTAAGAFASMVGGSCSAIGTLSRRVVVSWDCRPTRRSSAPSCPLPPT